MGKKEQVPARAIFVQGSSKINKESQNIQNPNRKHRNPNTGGDVASSWCGERETNSGDARSEKQHQQTEP